MLRSGLIIRKFTLVTGMFLCFFGLAYTINTQAADYPQWRGFERSGVSRETGLLNTTTMVRWKQWLEHTLMG